MNRKKERGTRRVRQKEGVLGLALERASEGKEE